jgi:hypothetical protein
VQEDGAERGWRVTAAMASQQCMGVAARWRVLADDGALPV